MLPPNFLGAGCALNLYVFHLEIHPSGARFVVVDPIVEIAMVLVQSLFHLISCLDCIIISNSSLLDRQIDEADL